MELELVYRSILSMPVKQKIDFMGCNISVVSDVTVFILAKALGHKSWADRVNYRYPFAHREDSITTFAFLQIDREEKHSYKWPNKFQTKHFSLNKKISKGDEKNKKGLLSKTGVLISWKKWSQITMQPFIIQGCDYIRIVSKSVINKLIFFVGK